MVMLMVSAVSKIDAVSPQHEFYEEAVSKSRPICARAPFRELDAASK
jgi:hypothetical protein